MRRVWGSDGFGDPQPAAAGNATNSHSTASGSAPSSSAAADGMAAAAAAAPAANGADTWAAGECVWPDPRQPRLPRPPRLPGHGRRGQNHRAATASAVAEPACGLAALTPVDLEVCGVNAAALAAATAI